MSPIELVEKLKQQHQNILSGMEAVKTEIANTHFDISLLMSNLYRLLSLSNEHLELEKQLFADFKSKKLAKNENDERINKLINEFAVIDKLQDETRAKYTDPNTIVNNPNQFKSDCDELCSMVTAKIDEEEESIFPDYLRICSEP
jgi:hypothetical protein